MKPERWQKIEGIYHAALEREEGQRAAFLNEACGGDESLRREVESLLTQEGETGSFLEAPALEVAAKVMAEDSGRSLLGRQLGSYQVLSLLGTGGMGEVYRAHDRKLGRDVAIKVLPKEFSQDPERLGRLEREARMLASLNHPHIGAIHTLEESDGVRFLVLELVAGETLAEQVKAGPLEVPEALRVCAQIAEALEAAHERGVIHRDLKPANVKVTPEGQVKVLDFGLAKALRRAFSHRRMSLKTGVGAFCVAGAPFWFFGFDLGTGESSSELWECGNRGAISKGGGKRGKPGFGFPRFPPPGISTTLFLLFSMASWRA